MHASKKQPQRRSQSQTAKFGGNESGVAGIEFAMVSPAFFFLVFVIMETALVFLAEEVLDNAVTTAARMVRTGQVQSAGMTKDEFKSLVCDNAGVFLDCEGPDFFVDVKTYGNFGEAGLGSPLDADGEFLDPGDFAYGGPNDVVVVRAYYKWSTNPIFGSITLSNMANGKRLLGSFATFRNEPFPAE